MWSSSSSAGGGGGGAYASGNNPGVNNLVLSAAKSECSSLMYDDTIDHGHGHHMSMETGTQLGMRHNLALLNPKQQQYNNYVTYAFVFHQTLVDLMRILYCLFYANNMYFEYKRYF